MIETATSTTVNGYEIQNPTEKLSAYEFRDHMASEFGIDGESPRERLEQIKSLSVEGFAILMEDINKGLQGSKDSLMSHESVVKIGETPTINLEERYDTFLQFTELIKNVPDWVNPGRVGDVMALGVVFLHPFHDGNGRTARALAFLCKKDYDDAADYEKAYSDITMSGEEANKRGVWRPNGYVPKLPEGFDRSSSQDVIQYLSELLTEEKPGAYTPTFDDNQLMARDYPHKQDVAAGM